MNLADMLFPKSQEKTLSQTEQAALELAKGMIDIQTLNTHLISQCFITQLNQEIF